MTAGARIVVRLPNWTGDVVMATPALRALRAHWPAARILAQLPAGLAPLLEGAPWVDDVLPLEGWRAGPRATWRDLRALRDQSCELGLCLPDSLSSALLMRAGGVRRVIGHARGARGLALHESVAVPVEWGARRRVARERKLLHLLEAIGCPPCGTATELHTTAAEEERALAAVGAGGPLVALAPGASYGPSKLWPTESFARVGDALAQRGARVVVVGTPEERLLAARLCEAMRAQALDLCGRLDLGAVKALLRRAALVVCNDAGARHIAVALGTPAIVMMGPTALEKTDCNLERVTVLQTQVECRPCYRRVCPIDHRCMTRLAPERVIEAALPLLERVS